METTRTCSAIVIGTSSGGLAALSMLLEPLPFDYPVPIIIVQHRYKDHRILLEELLQSKCDIRIKQADEKERIEKSTVYLAPPDYHLLIEDDRTFSLSSDALVSYSRPSIDVLFETAASVFGKETAGILLTGANSDGAAGLQAIKDQGGLTIAQDPISAQSPYMPQAAIDKGSAMLVMPLEEILQYLLKNIRPTDEAGS